MKTFAPPIVCSSNIMMVKVGSTEYTEDLVSWIISKCQQQEEMQFSTFCSIRHRTIDVTLALKMMFEMVMRSI